MRFFKKARSERGLVKTLDFIQTRAGLDKYLKKHNQK